MNFNLYDYAKKKIIVVAHRGSAAGNIPCNTIPAYETALLSGADMIEIDVDASADGKLYIFHPGMEKAHLGADVKIGELTSEEIKNLRYVNYDRTPTQFTLNTLDEIFEQFRGRCFINVDKFWCNPEKITAAIKRHNIMDQILVKSSPSKAVFDVLRELAPDIAFMPIVRRTHPSHGELVASKINYIGAEVLFDSEENEVASEEFIDMMHRDKKLVWANSIIYNHKDQLTAGHSDDAAICGDPEYGWGWLARRGFDFIQTDWTSLLTTYLDKNGLLYRK